MMPDGWDSYRRLVLSHMEKTEATLTRIEDRLTLLRVKVASIAGLAGLIAGGLVSLLIKSG